VAHVGVVPVVAEAVAAGDEHGKVVRRGERRQQRQQED